MLDIYCVYQASQATFAQSCGRAVPISRVCDDCIGFLRVKTSMDGLYMSRKIGLRVKPEHEISIKDEIVGGEVLRGRHCRIDHLNS